jgi:hypothetical protein
MLLITTACEWCESVAPTETVIVKGFEHATHNVCEDCTMATDLVDCAYCDNNATFMVDTFYFNPRYYGMCDECAE